MAREKEVKSELTKHVEALEKERHDNKVQATLKKHQAHGAITATQEANPDDDPDDAAGR